MQPTAAAKSGGDASGLKPSTTVEGCTDKTQPSSQPGRKEQGQGEGERGPTAAPKPAPSTTPSVCGKTDIAAAPKQGAGDAAAPSRRSAAESEAKGSARRVRGPSAHSIIRTWELPRSFTRLSRPRSPRKKGVCGA
eukprot:3552887-Pleurochrysis_carterae.AAC.1